MEQLLIILICGFVGAVCTFIIVQYIRQFTERVDDAWSFVKWFITAFIVLFVCIYTWKWFFEGILTYIRP